MAVIEQGRSQIIIDYLLIPFGYLVGGLAKGAATLI